MTQPRKYEDRGSALVLALAVLGLLVAAGFTMYRSTIIEQQSAAVDFDKDRALWNAKSGVQDAIGRLQTAIASGKADELTGADTEIAIPIYRLEGRNPGAAADVPVIDDRYTSKAVVTISDESARMNVNLAPPAVLMSILKIDGEKARQLREQLPRLDGTSADAHRHWLASVDDLAGRQLVPADSLTPEIESELTVSSAIDLQDPSGFVNLNTASSPVIQAALGVTPEVAEKVIAARPLNSLEALTAAAGKDSSGFNFKPAPDNPGALPKELAFSSRCFRIKSTARLTKVERGVAMGSATVEAIVQFPENQAPRIVYWNEGPAGANAAK